jgi:hypothetical protein
MSSISSLMAASSSSRVFAGFFKCNHRLAGGARPRRRGVRFGENASRNGPFRGSRRRFRNRAPRRHEVLTVRIRYRGVGSSMRSYLRPGPSKASYCDFTVA